MKKIFSLMLIASAFFCVSASAQKMNGKMGMEKQTLIDSLKLSSTAADSIVSIREQSMSQIKSIRDDKSLTDENQKKEKIKAIKQDMKTRLKKYLTDDQMAKMQQMQMSNKKNKGTE
jgi:hypothetical protein